MAYFSKKAFKIGSNTIAKQGVSPMNDKRAFRLLQREFTWQDGLYLWQSRIVSALADRYLKSGSGRRFLLRIRKAISQGLPQEHTALRELLIAENEKEPFTEEQLAALPHALTLSTLQLVVQTKDRALRAQAFRDGVRILRAFDRIDFTRLHDTLSVLHRKLMELDLHNYRNLDEHSRAHVCSRVVRYAKRHHLSECKAATMYAKQAPKPDTARRTALALSLFLALGTLFSVGGFLLFGRGAGLLLVLPFFALSATATQALLIKVFSPIPVLSLRPGTISEKNATLVVITALLSGKQADEALFAKLRRYYYRNRQKNVRFGILADLPESTHTTDPKDKEVLARALSCFEALEKECPGHFCLFVRSRVRCATEGNYMGWERKRGAILELCRATRGKKHSFSLCTLSEAELRSFRYLITLDSDTELSMDSVSELVFTMLHPENIPVVQNGIVVSGYGVLQPRMIASMDSAGKTGFTILQTGSAGKDSYGAYRQDFDQNTFGKSGFCGKGILDIDAFLATLDDAFPEERVLSHDLLEGTRLRCGALCQNALTDSVPKTPISFLKRQHRWMRGDLQSLPFSLPHHRNSRQQKVKNPIDLVGKVQILRNLLFLLRPIFCFACTVYALFLPAAQGTALFLLATLHLSIPLALRVLRHFHHANRRFYSRVLHGVQMGLSEMLYGFASLAETACLHLDALLRSLWRMLFSQKHLLEWVTAEHSELGGTNTLVGCLLFFWKSLVLGLLILILAPVGILTVFGFMTLLFPFACYFLSRPLSQKRSATPAERQFLLEHAKNAYGYYETFVTHQSNYLPPDNYQYTPVARLAERTSPTNIAMYLLSTLAARDLGFLDSTGLYERLDRTLESLSRLPKYKGHLYNWYSTKTLEVLGTPYVSTVDSGNLITSLLTLRYGIDDYCSEEPRLAKLISQIDRTIAICDFSFLYNKERHLFCIGYDTVSGTQSENCYDLFMSESRTTSYFCIAKGIVEKKHWQYLSRPLLKHEGHMGMASWSGTAFEYFLPTLFLPTVPNSLCYECLGFAFYEQLCDKSHGIWGRSESGYYAFDRDLNYQYKAFGAHRLALDPDSVKNDVIAPYASILCLEMSLCFPIKNLKRMMQSDLYGPFGFYEAVDYTPARVGGGYGIVRSYMAHHVGMSILAIASAVDGKRFAERFMRDPEMEAASELLCERIPVDAPIRRRLHRRPMPDSLKKRVTPPEDFGKTTSKGLPGAAGLLSDQLSLLATSEGFVKLTAKQYALTYPLCDERSALRGLRLLVQTDGGQIHDVFRCQNRQFGRFEDALVFSSEEKNLQSRAAFTLCCDKPILSLTLELKGEFTNATPMLLSEVILASEKDWQSHPCYTGLFVECVHRAEDNALLFRRRPKSESEAPFYFLVTMEGGGFDFLSRRDEAFGPMYQEEDLQHLYQKPFSNRDGQCILPFFCLRRSSCCPRGKFSCEFLFAAGNDAEELLKQIRSYRKARASTVGALLAPSYKQEIRARLLASGYDRSLVRYEQVILSSILHNTRQTADRLLSTHSELLWRHGVSTDLPMIALYCTQPQLSDSAKRILQGFLKAQKFLALGGFHFDLLIFHRQSDLYGCPEQKAIKQIIFESVGESVLQRKGGVFPICDENTAQACRYLCPIFWTLDENAVFAKLWQAHFSLNRPTPVIDCLQKPRESVLAAKEVLLSLPGGAFLQDGSYRVNKSRCTAPQSYLYCSHQFGTLVTHNSAGVTFFRNASEFSLTERNTDPLLDMNGERLILSENGHLYDLCATAHTVDFTRSCAIYRGSTAMLQYEVRIGCDDKLPVKAILVQLENKTELSIP
ncbi:MAG: DUF3131 domain-containing protein, partial [Ruminococcaceae bacterium]|nr:DUF3131 domain-containing protein [Oscillospiraceae bacterium]